MISYPEICRGSKFRYFYWTSAKNSKNCFKNSEAGLCLRFVPKAKWTIWNDGVVNHEAIIIPPRKIKIGDNLKEENRKEFLMKVVKFLIQSEPFTF